MRKKAPSPRLRVVSVQSPQSMEVSMKQDERHLAPDPSDLHGHSGEEEGESKNNGMTVVTPSPPGLFFA